MNRESIFLMGVWDAVRDNLPPGKRSDIAVSIVTAAADYGWDASDLRDIMGEDDILTEAVTEVFELEEDDFDEEEEDDE